MDWVNWKVEKLVSKGEYWYAVVLNHPNRTKNNYVLYHRIVMENKLKRLLTKDELVHHVNENKKDCSENNLELKTRSTHARYHNLLLGRATLEIVCPQCGNKFIVFKDQSYLCKGGIYTTCSPSCRGKLSRHIQLYGINDEIKLKIKNSIVREFRTYGS